MRSPGLSSSPAMREPPTKRVPSTIPAGGTRTRERWGWGGGAVNSTALEHFRCGAWKWVSIRGENPRRSGFPSVAALSQKARPTLKWLCPPPPGLPPGGIGGQAGRAELRWARHRQRRGTARDAPDTPTPQLEGEKAPTAPPPPTASPLASLLPTPVASLHSSRAPRALRKGPQGAHGWWAAAAPGRGTEPQVPGGGESSLALLPLTVQSQIGEPLEGCDAQSQGHVQAAGVIHLHGILPGGGGVEKGGALTHGCC